MVLSASRDSFFSPGVADIYARTISDEVVLSYVRVASHALDAQYRRDSGTTTFGHRVFRLAMGLGFPPHFASRCGIYLDALQPVVDMADNLADVELDRARGFDTEALYRDIPLACRPALPSLMLGAWTAAFDDEFTPPFRGQATRTWILEVLANALAGQGYDFDDPNRIRTVSVSLGRLWALPLRLWGPSLPDPHDRGRVVETWGTELAVFEQLHWDRVERPKDDRCLARVAEQRARLLAAWPSFAPFRANDSYTPHSLGVV